MQKKEQTEIKERRAAKRVNAIMVGIDQKKLLLERKKGNLKKCTLK